MNKKEIEKWLKKYNIKNYIINDDLTVDVNRSVYINSLNLKEIPVNFNVVQGDFFCYNNKLTSLKGSPKVIQGGFFCNNNKLTSLKGCPKVVKGSFFCNNNKLTDYNDWTKNIHCWKILKEKLKEDQLKELLLKEPEWLEFI